MGNTCASVDIALTGATPDAIDGIVRHAGYRRAERQVDRTALAVVAEITETSDAFKIVLREGQRLDDLELALLPVLPVESVRVHM